MSTSHRAGSAAVPGGTIPLYIALPDSGQGPGIVLFHEIFGLNEHIRGRADRLAGIGYVVVAPDFFWRLGPDRPIDEGEPDAMTRGMGQVQQLDISLAVQDGVAVLDHLRVMHEVRGGVGVLGYCFGGMLAFQVAARSQPDAAVLYYPSVVHELLEVAPGIHCPTLYEFGSADEFLPHDVADRVRDATAGAEGVQVIVHEGANHAFDNERFRLHHAEAAAAAWREAQQFLSRWLPAGR